MNTTRPTADQLAKLIRNARERVLTCPVHLARLDPNGLVCPYCIVVSRRPALAGAMRPISQILNSTL